MVHYTVTSWNTTQSSHTHHSTLTLIGSNGSSTMSPQRGRCCCSKLPYEEKPVASGNTSLESLQKELSKVQNECTAQSAQDH
eukprot:3625029-Amphidinium_carterae.1